MIPKPEPRPVAASPAGVTAPVAAPAVPAAWWRRWARRQFPDVWFKTVGISGAMAVFFLFYFDALARAGSRAVVMPLIGLDDWVPFVPASLWIYVTLWLYVSIPAGHMPSRAALVRYGVLAAGMCGVAIACFYLWPTRVPPVPLDWAAHPGFGVLKGMDVGNACPSLHVATAVFSCVWLHRQLADVQAPRIVLALNLAWCLAIVWSTMATRQHVALDVLAGIPLGLVFALPFRGWVMQQRFPA